MAVRTVKCGLGQQESPRAPGLPHRQTIGARQPDYQKRSHRPDYFHPPVIARRSVRYRTDGRVFAAYRVIRGRPLGRGSQIFPRTLYNRVKDLGPDEPANGRPPPNTHLFGAARGKRKGRAAAALKGGLSRQGLTREVNPGAASSK